MNYEIRTSSTVICQCYRFMFTTDLNRHKHTHYVNEKKSVQNLLKQFSMFSGKTDLQTAFNFKWKKKYIYIKSLLNNHYANNTQQNSLSLLIAYWIYNFAHVRINSLSMFFSFKWISCKKRRKVTQLKWGRKKTEREERERERKKKTHFSFADNSLNEIESVQKQHWESEPKKIAHQISIV